MARRAIENREDLGEALIQAAEATIRRDGYSALTARRIAKDLGISVGTVYNVHGSMDQLIEAVNARTLSGLERRIAAIDLQKGGVEDILVEFATRYMSYVQDNLNLWSVLFDGQLSPSAELNQATIDRLFGFLEQALAPVAPDEETRARSARVLWASVHGILQMAYTGRLQLLKIDDVQAVVRHAIRCHLGGLTSA